MTELELNAAIKSGAVRGFYFFYGDEDYTKNHTAAQMRRIVCPDPSFEAFNAISLSFGDGELDVGQIGDALLAPPLMSTAKIVDVSLPSIDALKEKERTALLDCIRESAESGDDGVNLTFILRVTGGGFDPGQAKRPSAFLSAAQKFMIPVDFAYQTETRLIRWMERHFAQYGLVIAQQTAAMIIARCGRSMYRLAGEIAKTAAYTANRCAGTGFCEVTPADVDACVTRTDEDDAFAMANHILDGNTSAALECLGVKIRRREDSIFLLAQITKVFTDLAAAAAFTEDGREKSEFAKAMKMHEYKAGLYLKAVKAAPAGFIAEMTSRCADADQLIKSSPLGYEVIERLICGAGSLRGGN
ncbi:MAG: DNA polymerase III subunit delta [Clostridia bacterium]|nr:DNA polymerase III subunit delta [Clostridia bacterium]